MYNYASISIVALFCYLFLFIAFMAAQKNKIIKSFLLLLAGFLLWTGGSLFMRTELWPGSAFWFHLSIAGLILLPFMFFNFVYAMVDSKDTFLWKVWLLMGIVNYAINIKWGVYIPQPEIVRLANGYAGFVYHITWPICILFLTAACPIVHMIGMIRSNYKRNALERDQFQPIIIGVVILFLGHIGTLVPVFRGFPTDVLSGIINAGFLFYALYRKRLFRLNLLVSRGIVYAISTLLVAVGLANSINPLHQFIQDKMPYLKENSILILAVFFALATFLISTVVKSFIDTLFAKSEMLQAERLRNFSEAVSRSLNNNSIMEEIVSVIHEMIETERIYICLETMDGSGFELVHLSSLLEGRNYAMRKDNPMIRWLTQFHKCMLLSDFRRTIYYKSMWESEKEELARLDIHCILPLQDEDHLVGMVLLSSKRKGKHYTHDDISFLESISSIASIAVRNSRLYEKAYMEARIDELTGLLNRKYFYEVLNQLYEKNQGWELALIIFNVDDFKLYNQLYGMKEGDIALQNVAKIIKSSVGERGYIARYSGKEFAVILSEYDVLAAKELAESIRLQIMEMNKWKKNFALKVMTVSCGICSIPYSASNVQQLIENADMAVYTVKRKGKNGVQVYDIGSHIEGNLNEQDRTAKEEMYAAYQSTVIALTATIDTKDHYTFSHSNHVAEYASQLAVIYGMGKDFIELVREAALLHDIGKIGIPEHILNKTGRLEDHEYEIMKSHVESSIGIIQNLPSLDYVIPAVIGHHERFDGRGYPRGIAGEDIPLSARILCIADSFDAMISKRSYKEAFSIEYALDELNSQAGRQFDPVLAPLFVQSIREGKIKPIASI